MSAVDKLLKLAGQEPATTLVEDPAGDLVLAARTAIAGLRVCLASSDDDDDDGDNDHSSHGTYKALVKRGMDKGKAASMCAKADKRVKAARLAEAAEIALAGLAVPGHDWVEATATTPGLLLSGPAYADPGHRGKQRYLVDTEPHTRLSAAYLALAGPGYTQAQLEQVQGKVRAAARTYGIALTVDEEAIAVDTLLGLSVLTAEDRKKPSAHTLGDSEDYPIPDKAHLTAAVARYKQGKYAGHKPAEIAAHIRSRAKALGVTVDLAAGSGLDEAADLVALAKKAPMGDGGIIMNHGPFNGTHTHGHFQSNVHDHPHQHFGDNHHDGGPAHRPGSKPGGRAGY